MKRFLFIASLICLGAFLTYFYDQKFLYKAPQPNIVFSPTPTKKTGLDADELWSLINEYRVKKGLKPFIKNQELCKIAQQRAEETKELGKLDNHKGFYAKYSSEPYKLSENVVGPGDDSYIAFSSWLNSPKHKQAIESSYTYACLAVSGRFAVQIFSSFDSQDHLSH